ncbi:kinase-like protein [Gigaspora margarita]|uniref:Kinase-like protein n=1 Tax=Gigaspora margarita TaxID=4874 RepID=A0A8H3X6Z0_GIGMA|nr:kinase-like protein [Gigaspora margarita]
MPAYIDPQCLKEPKYKRNKKSDIYSFGFILWEISSGKTPFQSYRSVDAIHILIYQGKREIPVHGTPKQYCDLYTLCWDDDPQKRPKIEEVLEILNNPISFDDTISNGTQYLSTQDYSTIESSALASGSSANIIEFNTVSIQNQRNIDLNLPQVHISGPEIE